MKKQFAFFRINPDIDAKLMPQAGRESINNDFEDEKWLLAHLCHEKNPEHPIKWYADRVVACDIERDSLGWQNAVCCIANSGESPTDNSTHNVLMDNGNEYLYFAEDGTPVIANICDEYENVYYRVHKFREREA